MDTNLYFRKVADGNLTADETDDLKIGPMSKPMALEVIVPQDSALDSLDISLIFSATSGGAAVATLTLPQIPAAGTGRYFLPFFTNQLWVRCTWNVTDGGGGVNYGAVVGKIVPVGYDAQK